MSDSDEQLVSIELPRAVWLRIAEDAKYAQPPEMGDLLLSKIPPPPVPFPVRLGAVIRAHHEQFGDLTLVRTSGATREPTYLHWRDAEEGRFYAEADLWVTEILSAGIAL